jgi:small subunit ribosomal protein S3
MGRKVNPHGVRLGFNKTWASHWFAGTKLSLSLQEDYAIRDLIAKKHPKASISHVEIFRNRGEVVVNIHTAKPGIVIGRSGKGVQELRHAIETAIARVRKSTERANLRLNIVEVKNP